MKRKITNIIFGAALVIVGLIYCLSLLGVISYDFSFDGWWTLFIIIPCVMGMVDNGINLFNTTGFGIGVILLLTRQDVIPNNIGYKLIVPFVIIMLGLRLIFRKNTKILPSNFNKANISKPAAGVDFYAIFGGNSPQFNGQSFNGCNTYAVFGGVELDLRNAVINQNCIINTYSIFGGTDIYLPANVKAVVNGTPVFGGVDNTFISNIDPAAPVVLINAVTVFGGTDIK